MKMAIVIILTLALILLVHPRKFTKNHKTNFRSKFKTGKCNTSIEKVTAKDIELIVNLHNEYREQLTNGTTKFKERLPFATNMIKMYWSDTLAQKAQDIADLCKTDHSSYESRKIADYHAGENIHFQYWKNGRPRMRWKNAVTVWYNQMNDFLGKKIAKYRIEGPETNDYTQMIWANTYLVGCGYSTFVGQYPGTIANLYVCLYGPIGNNVGKSVYKPSPVKKCECLDGLGCANKEFSGLCCPSGLCDKEDIKFTGDLIPGTY